MNTALITHLTELIKDACARDSNIFGYGIWTHHILPMTQMVPELAKLHDADEEMVLIAVLLHDYAGIKDASMVGDHHLHGAALARSLLSDADYPDERIVVIEEAIRDHRGSAPGARITAEARCMADCDAIAHITRLPSLFHVAYVEMKKEIDSGTEWILGKIQRDWEKLSPAGQDYVRDAYDAAVQVLSPGR